jgi:hypothetical protein
VTPYRGLEIRHGHLLRCLELVNELLGNRQNAGPASQSHAPFTTRVKKT